MREGHAQDPYVAAGVGFEPATFRMQGTGLTTEPPLTTMSWMLWSRCYRSHYTTWDYIRLDHQFTLQHKLSNILWAKPEAMQFPATKDMVEGFPVPFSAPPFPFQTLIANSSERGGASQADSCHSGWKLSEQSLDLFPTDGTKATSQLVKIP